MAQQLILLVKVSAEHLSRLVNGVFDLDGHSRSSLGFLHDLFKHVVSTDIRAIEEKAALTSCVL